MKPCRMVCAILFGSFAPAAFGQAEPPPAPPVDEPSRPAQAQHLESVVVSARRVREPLQSVPIAITSFDQEQLDRNQVHSLVDLQQFVPSASVNGYNSRQQEWFSLRGQGQTGLETGGGVGGGPAVVGYLAEVPVSIAGPGLYYDLASVQVLKGPQGTLFGRNTTGGAILFEPRQPGRAFEAYASLTGGDYSRGEFAGAVNVPVSESLAIRIAAQTGHRDGYTHDPVKDTTYQKRDFNAARFGALFSAGRLENYFLANWVDYKESGSGNVLLFVKPGNPQLDAALALQQAIGIRQAAHSVANEEDKGKFLTAINRTSYKLSENLTLRNIASWTHWRTLRRADEDGTALIILDSLGPLPGTWHKDQEVFTDELQLQGNALASRLKWQAGAYYEHSKNPDNTSFSQQFATNFFLHTFRIDQGNISKGLYGQGTYALDEILRGLKFTAGYRRTRDTVSFGVAFAGSGTPLPAPGDPCFSVPGSVYPDNCLVSDAASHSGSSYTLGLDWQIDPATLLYVVTRQGYKSGGFNIVATQLGATDSDFYKFKPETVRDVEIGFKKDWSLGAARGRSNVALYYSIYDDAQALTTALVAGTVQGVTANAARAKISGLELENTVRPWQGTEFNLTYSYMDARYKRYITPLGNDLTDTPYPNAPRHKLAAGARFRLPVTDSSRGDVWVGGTYTYQSDVYVGIGDNGPGSPGNTQPGYGLVNLRADWYDVMGTRLDLSLFVTNAANKAYQVTTLDLFNTLGYTVATFGEPRMYGVTARYSF